MSEDLLNDNGLSVKTGKDIRDELVASFKEIYGDDINLDSNTQDGQIIDIFTKFNTDIREMIQEIYNTGDPDLCRGAIQDVRYRINNLFRQAGSFTEVEINVTANKTVKLDGLDSNINDISAAAYGVSDDAGNVFYLINSHEIEGGKSEHLLFRASVQGDIYPTIGTIVNQVTIVPGITSVINDRAPLRIGRIEETDAEFAYRRERATELKAMNSNDAMRSQLLNLPDVTDAYVYNHDYEHEGEGGLDPDGIPPHYIWVIVDGGSPSDIASTIYANSTGAGMVGSIEAETLTASKQKFKVKYDRVEGVPLFIDFTIQETVAGSIFNEEQIIDYIVKNLIYEVNEFAETSKITEVIKNALNANGANGVPVDVKITLTKGRDYKYYIECPSKKNKFTIAPSDITWSEINING